jgi:hypothetical protein
LVDAFMPWHNFLLYQCMLLYFIFVNRIHSNFKFDLKSSEFATYKDSKIKKVSYTLTGLG